MDGPLEVNGRSGHWQGYNEAGAWGHEGHMAARPPSWASFNLKLATVRPLAVASFKGHPRVSLWHERRVLRATFGWLLPVAAMIAAQCYSGMRGRCLVLPLAPEQATEA